jgi:molybdopterin molybdotransferase
MAHLMDDCGAFSGPPMLLDEMEQLIAEWITPVVETETVVLSAGRGRVVASNVEAPVNMRHFDNTAVDGYETTKRARC